MPELFLELFSEEIPARMQASGAADLARLATEALAPLSPAAIRTFHGPRRLALAAIVASAVAPSAKSERGPRIAAPEQALAGFLRKHGALREELRQEGEFWVLQRSLPGIDAAALVAREIPPLLRRFPWPKSMRWGGTSGFTWVRPLRRILCLLDSAVVRFDLRDGEDDGHGLASAALTEGHRFLAPGAFAVSSCAEWQTTLRDRFVVANADERRALVWNGLRARAAEHGLTMVEDAGLLDEVTSLVEWPVAMLGRIDPKFMDLPAEVLQVSMRVNQRYFALRDASGKAAPFFAFAANVPGDDGGAAIVAGNERVLGARFSDARHFWDLDRRTKLADRVAALDAITFHAKLGTQGERTGRIMRLAGHLAPLTGTDKQQAERAAKLAKADLTAGMVGEFPELQGHMGRYYAMHDGEAGQVADAVRDHYAPKGPGEAVPDGPVALAVGLADRLDMLTGFFAIDERPTGSGDPYALRRAALGVIRILRERALHCDLGALLEDAAQGWASQGLYRPAGPVWDFIAERLRVQLRAEGARHDVLAAVLSASADRDIVRLLARTEALAALLGTETGASLLAAFRRAANILRIEERKDGPHDGAVDPALLEVPEEQALAAALGRDVPAVEAAIGNEDFSSAMSTLAALQPPVDAFFDRVTVNDERAELRRNRLRLLARLCAAMNGVADFSKIEG